MAISRIGHAVYFGSKDKDLKGLTPPGGEPVPPVSQPDATETPPVDGPAKKISAKLSGIKMPKISRPNLPSGDSVKLSLKKLPYHYDRKAGTATSIGAGLAAAFFAVSGIVTLGVYGTKAWADPKPVEPAKPIQAQETWQHDAEVLRDIVERYEEQTDRTPAVESAFRQTLREHFTNVISNITADVNLIGDVNNAEDLGTLLKDSNLTPQQRIELDKLIDKALATNSMDELKPVINEIWDLVAIPHLDKNPEDYAKFDQYKAELNTSFDNLAHDKNVTKNTYNVFLTSSILLGTLGGLKILTANYSHDRYGRNRRYDKYTDRRRY